MANLLDSYGLDFLGKDEDTLMGAVRYTVQEGKAIKGYYDTPYFYLPIGSAEFWASATRSLTVKSQRTNNKIPLFG